MISVETLHIKKSVKNNWKTFCQKSSIYMGFATEFDWCVMSTIYLVEPTISIKFLCCNPYKHQNMGDGFAP